MRRRATWASAAVLLSLALPALAREPDPVTPKTFGWLDFSGNIYARGQYDTETRNIGGKSTLHQHA